MQQMKCAKCGAEIQEGDRFCSMCGCMAEVVRPVRYQSADQTENSTKSKKLTASSVILSIILSLLLVILGTAASDLFIIKKGLGQKAIESAVSRIELAELKTGALFGSGDKNETLPELIYDNLPPDFKVYMSDRKEAIAYIEDFLEEEFVQEFVADKVNDYVEDMLTDSGEGKIEVDEVMKFLRHHQDELEKLTPPGYQLTSEDFDTLEYYLTQNIDLDDYKFANLRRENKTAFNLIERLCSNPVLGILLGLCVLLAIVLFIVNKKFTRTMVYLGVSFVLIGILDCVEGFMFDLVSGMMNDIARLGEKFYNALFFPTRMWSFIVGGCMIVVGILIAVMPRILRKRHQ